MIGQTNSQTAGADKVTESTVSGWGFTKSKIDIEDVNESIDDLEVEYATKGYVDSKIEEVKEGQVDIDLSDYAKKTDLQGKVDKVTGKQLSTEDFTTSLKNKLNGLSNYDDSAINSAVSKLRTDFDTLVSGDTSSAIETFNEIISFLNGVSDTESLEGIIAGIEQQIAGKGTYSKPSGGIPKSDLASSVQSSLNKADTALQTHQDISGKQDKLVSGTNIKTINGQSILGSGNISISGGGGGGGSIDPELLEAYMPMSRDFNDDFNDSFAR